MGLIGYVGLVGIGFSLRAGHRSRSLETRGALQHARVTHLARFRPILCRAKRTEASSMTGGDAPYPGASSPEPSALLEPARRLNRTRKLWPSTFCRRRRCARACLGSPAS